MKNKQKKEELGQKQVDAIANQNDQLAALINEDDHKNNCKVIFEELVKKDLMK